MNKSLLAIGMAIPCLGFSQQFQQVFGGDGFDMIYELIQHEDQSYTAFGITSSFGDQAGMIIQMDGMGNLQSASELTVMAGLELSDITENEAGNLFFAGTASSDAAGNGEVIAGEMTTSGDVLWANGFSAGGNDGIYGICNAPDGGVACAGITNSYSPEGDFDGVVMKYTADGELQWANVIEIDGYERLNSIVVHPDGGYVAYGHHGDPGDTNYDPFFIRLSDQGDLVSIKRYAAPAIEIGWEFMQFENGFLIGGDTQSFGEGLNEVFLMYVDLDGEIIWQKTYGGFGHDHITSIAHGKAGRIVFGGTTSSIGAGGLDAMAVELEADGTISWSKAYGGEEKDVGFSTLATPDGGYIFSGYSRSFSQNIFYDGYIIKTNERGDCMCNSVWDLVLTQGEAGFEIDDLSGSKFELTSFNEWEVTTSPIELTNAETLCTYGDLVDNPGGEGEENSGEVTNISEYDNPILDLVPVPLDGTLMVEVDQHRPGNLSVYTVTGKMVQNVGVQPLGRQRIPVKVKGLSQGIYLVTLIDSQATHTKKVYVN